MTSPHVLLSEAASAGPAPVVPLDQVLKEKDLKALHEPHGEKDSADGYDHDHNKDALAHLDDDANSENIIIRTGADAANFLLPLRDDHDSALTFRSIVLGSLVAAFQAAMNQIYNFKPTAASISGSFLILIVWVFGVAWAKFLPRGDHFERRWLAKNGQGPIPLWLKTLKFINPGPFGLKEHAVAAITASSASNGTAGIYVFTVQNLFYSNPLSGVTVVLSTLSIGLFGYGLTGLLRPITVFAVESVYWSNIPTVKMLQTLHWEDAKSSIQLRHFWYAFIGMTLYEFIPAYIFPWLNSVSIPCLASMHATGSKAAVLTNLFGGSLSNEGLGILNFSFDWQYITTAATAVPLILQMNFAIGLVICWIAFIGLYYNNAWDARSQPFLATTLRTAEGGRYPSQKVFVDGILDTAALAKYGTPRLAGTYTWAMMVGNGAIGAVIGHCIFFWGGDILKTIKGLRKGEREDRHHAAMRDYKEAPWYWYASVLVFAFVLGLVVVIKEDITLPAWAYIVALVLGIIIAPFSTILYARFGNGIATNALMKMLAGVIIPGRPLGNLYFSAWSHAVIAQSLNLASDLKEGIYLKIPPRVMFLTQIWGTVLGAFINYAVMISIVNSKRELLVDTNGDYAWSGQQFQSMNTQATAWALAKYLYSVGTPYVLVPVGLGIGFGLVLVHRVFVIFVPRVGRFDVRDLNIPTVLMYSGWLGYNQTQSCTVLSTLAAGFFVQYYLRTYRPKLYKESYLFTAALDGGALLTVFILSFAVLGAGGKTVPFPSL
nr:uncharacterized protein CI109_004660 [Kwoniella shandongensis]KAA5526884.1 hypothetical protein CI109_004660 [Kwoniella shandongensis]